MTAAHPGLGSQGAAAPPQIAGFDYLETLGSGGFADVYLYEQELPRRKVAIKVLRPESVSDEALQLFRDEADFLARLSAHPNIVSLHHAGTLDDGRLFLALEHCSRPSLGARFRHEEFSVAEVLSIGVQLADAVETAHRAGVLHRDIKPGNVLVTDYGRPALTDFGIAATLGRGATARAAGMSLPWAAPESIDSGWSGPETDVWGLAATLVSLLTGRTPFEGADETLTADELADRIRDMPLPAIERSDVPPSLQEALRTAMAKSPHGRFTSALSFARALQRVQHELGLPVTDIDVSGEPRGRTGEGSSPTRMGANRTGGMFLAGASGMPGGHVGSVSGANGAGTASETPRTVLSRRAGTAGHSQAATARLSTDDMFDSLLRGDAETTPLAVRRNTRGDTGETQLRALTAAMGASGVSGASADRAPTFAVAPKPPSKVPGIILDVALGLAVVGAGLYLLLG